MNLNSGGHKMANLNLIVNLMFIICLMPLSIQCLRFHLQPNTKRCLKEEMRKDVLVTGDYQLSDSPGVRTDLLVCFHTTFLFLMWQNFYKYF